MYLPFVTGAQLRELRRVEGKLFFLLCRKEENRLTEVKKVQGKFDSRVV